MRSWIEEAMLAVELIYINCFLFKNPSVGVIIIKMTIIIITTKLFSK